MRQRPVNEGDEFGLVVGAGLTESVCRRNRLVQLRARAEKTLIRRIILIVLWFSGVLFVV